MIKPQPGPQEMFLGTPADIAIYGGAAGGGKSFALLMEPLRHMAQGEFKAVIFRRTSKQVKNEGGLWDASAALYGTIGGRAKESELSWKFPSGASISFGHLEHEKNKYDWQGSELAFIGFDELTHFTETQFFYLLSRNRSTGRARPYVRGTCNPDADSWVADFIRWWIDPETGYPVPGRSGQLRWFVRDEDSLIWGDDKRALELAHPGQVAKSVTFIAASIDDNRILMERDPGYRANLAALSSIDRERLLKGNWKIRPAAGAYFRRSWFSVVPMAPVEARRVRGWDLAASHMEPGTSPDWTVGARLARDASGVFYVEHIERLRGTPNEVERAIRNLAMSDGRETQIALPQDPGQAGKAQVQALVRLLAGFRIKSQPVTGSKVVRAMPFSSQAEAGNVRLVAGPWNADFLNELENFPTGRHDDQVDAVCEAFHALTQVSQKSQQDMYS
ncbi:phage terminase large subunit [Sneathiella sp. HT1-7]|uniref:phage terminase large subunit n=1 Tax=Sneathiella sp. HT1-7 TaxID=2887192 RepID=UPI001D147A9A|nr:phage terminase large subunit [Sneathiella sp. HT1-7]MCC3304916.1 phage terminase large subunit [Sneathiella sp. HT1-7]